MVAHDATRILRVVPGQKDWKGAAPIQLHDLQVGDRVLVRGELANDSKSVLASSIVVMKRSDVEAKQQLEREDWQKRGVGGLVSAIDPVSGNITISTTAAGSAKTLTVHYSQNTVLRRYAPDSVKFDDAKIGTLDQIKTGDQLRARGTRSAGGSELAAEEIVTGAFRNIAGTITVLDSAAGTITVNDLLTKKPVLVKIAPESQLRKLSPEMAQRMASRLKGPPLEPAPNSSTGAPTGSKVPARGAVPGRQAHGSSEPFPNRPAGENPSGPGNGSPDLQQILSHMPAATIADLQKGDAVLIVSTQGSASGQVTAITLLGGVEPILASPQGTQAMVLSPWTLGQGGDATAAGTP